MSSHNPQGPGAGSSSAPAAATDHPSADADTSAAMKLAWHQQGILAGRPPPVSVSVSAAAAASATAGPSSTSSSSQAPSSNSTASTAAASSAPGSMRSSASQQLSTSAPPPPQHVTTYANSLPSSSAYNTPHSSLPPPPPPAHLQPHSHPSASSSRPLPLPPAAPMHPGPSASYAHHHAHHGQYGPGPAASSATSSASSQVLPTPPPPGTVRLDDYMIAMEARFLSSQDKYYDKAVRELDKYIRDLQDDADNEFNLALHDQCAVIQERVYQHKLHLEYVVSQAELMYTRDVEASETQLEAESEATKHKMLSELAVKKRRLEEERTQDVFSINLDNLDTTAGSRPNRAVRKTNKRGVADDHHAHGAGGGGHVGPRKKHIKQSSLLGPPKLDDDEVNEDLATLQSLTGMEVHMPPPVVTVGKGGRGAAGKRKG